MHIGELTVTENERAMLLGQPALDDATSLDAIAAEAITSLQSLTTTPHHLAIELTHRWEMEGGQVIRRSRWWAHLILLREGVAPGEGTSGYGDTAADAVCDCVRAFTVKWSERMRQAREVLSVA